MNSIANIIYKPYAILFIPFYHSILELFHLTVENLKPILKFISLGILVFALPSSLGYHKLALWCLKWIGLGILSSVGFGFGMHTFVLFLAPHIAAVTLASQTCRTLDFPTPPYPNEIICPDQFSVDGQITFVNVLQKVALESFMWGLGTAIGELPPYLAARLRGQSIGRSAGGDSLDSELNVAGWEVAMIKIIKKIGFIGILLCAAIPNPLFDAAGVASGIAQVPFISFFGATFVGKAIIKVLLQTSFVIFIFHNNNLDSLVMQFGKKLGEYSTYIKDLNLHGSLLVFLEEQRTNVLRKKLNEPRQTSMIATAFNSIIGLMMLLFVISVINALDKQYRERKAPKPTRRTN